MIPRYLPGLIASAGLAVALAACGEGTSEASGPATPPQPAPSVPSQAELEAQAAETIDASNADQELAKLKAELADS